MDTGVPRNPRSGLAPTLVVTLAPERVRYCKAPLVVFDPAIASLAAANESLCALITSALPRLTQSFVGRSGAAVIGGPGTPKTKRDFGNCNTSFVKIRSAPRSGTSGTQN